MGEYRMHVHADHFPIMPKYRPIVTDTHSRILCSTWFNFFAAIGPSDVYIICVSVLYVCAECVTYTNRVHQNLAAATMISTLN